jgi:hypothetical protein
MAEALTEWRLTAPMEQRNNGWRCLGTDVFRADHLMKCDASELGITVTWNREHDLGGLDSYACPRLAF